MRIRMAVILLFSVCSTGFGQQSACSVPVSVSAPDLSSLSESDVEAMVNEWKRNVQAKKYELPDGRWDWATESRDFAATLMRGKTASLMGRHSIMILTLPAGNLPAIKQPGMVTVRNLPAKAFLAGDKKSPIRILSATYDRGPRRVTFIAENGKKMPEAARKIEAAVMSHILSKARSEDSFALLTAGGPRVELHFGSSRDAIRAAAEQLANPPQGKSDGQGVLDAVLEATTWLQPPQPGDSIFLITLRLEGKHRANFSTVRAAVAAGRIRVFTFQLGEVFIRTPDTISAPAFGESWDMATFGHGLSFVQSLALSRESGGWAVVENAERGKEYKLTDERLQELARNGEQMYRGITEYYLLQLDSGGPDLSIRLAPPILEQLPWASVVYPKSLPPCSGPATPAPAHTETPR
jgi:hypothetical protein